MKEPRKPLKLCYELFQKKYLQANLGFNRDRTILKSMQDCLCLTYRWDRVRHLELSADEGY